MKNSIVTHSIVANARIHSRNRWLKLQLLVCIGMQFVLNHNSFAQTLDERLKAEPIEVLAVDARRDGDAVRGAGIFFARAMACATCHSVGDRLQSIGPDLAKIDAKITDLQIVESLLEPSKVIAAPYATVTVQTADGRQLSGLPVSENDQQLVLRDLKQPDKVVTIKKQDIEDRQAAKQSIMPEGQVNQLTDRRQFLDLVRYLIELREGGVKRARELLPPPDPFAQKVPDSPLAWRPVVQRGEVAVEGNLKYPHAVAIGFVGGTILFDANQLRTVATWQDGFVRSSKQNYFGLYWHREGGPADKIGKAPHPLSFQLSEQAEWQSFEPAATSDPNAGTRFGGYQIGRSAVRLHYHLLVGNARISVSEDVRVESHGAWRGVAREYRITGLPEGARVAVSLPESGGSYARRHSAAGGESAKPEQRLISPAAKPGEAVVFGFDTWKSGTQSTTASEQSASPPTSLIAMDDEFDQPRRTPTPLPMIAAVPQEEVPTSPVTQRPAVHPHENVDEFPATRGRFLRFVVTRTNDGSEPGIDELEVYGADPNVNLALAGKSTASSVISGYPIHQIPHINDGKLGNNNSWISSELGGGWAQIQFPKTVEMSKIVWARDRDGICKDRLAVAYRIEVSDDGATWKKVGDERGRKSPGIVVGKVRKNASPGYELESIPAPFPSCRPSDIAFGNDGTMYAIAMTEGQIWRTRTPPVGQPERVQWYRYATGLYHPIGLAIVDGRLYVAQKTEITELIDQNADGTVDHYRTVATGWGLSTGWHEYCFGLAVDPQKNLLFALNTGYFWTNPGYVNPGRWRGSILRVAHATEKLEVVAKGCRVPNGIAQGPDGNIFFTDNQGDWIQACKLAHIVPGRFYGHPETKKDALPKGTYPDGRSSIWLPYNRSRSVSGPVHDGTQGRFGPFANQMFLGDVGYGANAGIMRVALEKVNGEYQGACFRFVDGQPLGCERMRFGPDNQLYMASLTSGLTRMAFNGDTPLAMHSVKIRPGGAGFTVRLTKPLAVDTVLTPAQFRVSRYHYLYTGNYGSPEADKQTVPVTAAELSVDRKTITLTLPVETYPIGMVYALNLGSLISESGEVLLHNDAWYTVHQIPK